MHRSTMLPLAGALLMAIPAVGSAQQPDRLTLDVYLEWEQVQDPRVAPDGQQIIYTRRWVDKMNDRWES